MARIELPAAALPLAVLLVSMVACTTMPPPGAAPMPGGMCNAATVSWAIGRAATPDVVERARLESGSADVRVIKPGDMVTADFRGDRLNITVNERGAIIGLKCG